MPVSICARPPDREKSTPSSSNQYRPVTQSRAPSMAVPVNCHSTECCSAFCSKGKIELMKGTLVPSVLVSNEEVRSRQPYTSLVDSFSLMAYSTPRLRVSVSEKAVLALPDTLLR